MKKMDLRKTVGGGGILAAAIFIAAMIYVWFATTTGYLDSTIAIGLNIGFLVLGVLAYMVYSYMMSVKGVKKLATG